MSVSRPIKDYTHCAYCERAFSGSIIRTRDHFIPLSKGGKKSHKNIYIVCSTCNCIKGNFLPNEFTYWLRCRIVYKESVTCNNETFGTEILETIKKNIRTIDNRAPTPPKKTKPRKGISIKGSIKPYELNGVHYITFGGRVCKCVGFIDRSFFPGVKQYSNAFHDTETDYYVFIVGGNKRGYAAAAVKKFIKPFFPGTEDVSLSVNNNTPKIKSETLDEKVKRILLQPQMNFHEAD